MENQVIKDGNYLLSGIGTTSINTDFGGCIEGKTICLNGVTYVAYEDPDDGYRSIGYFHPANSSIQCQYKFPPQEVTVKNISKTSFNTEYAEDKELITIKDAKNGKKILTVGTDFFDSYYPVAVFEYHPENLEVNQKQIQ